MWMVLISFFWVAGPAFAECDTNASDTEITSCLGQDLRDSDKRINAVYKELMGRLDDTGKNDLRNVQRAWLKARDKACELDSKESDREKWLSAILADKQKTMCVVRYTFSRVAELDATLKQKAPEASTALPAAPTAPRFLPVANPIAMPSDGLMFIDDGYIGIALPNYRQGKWYYEVWIDRGNIAALGDMLLTMGFSTNDQFYAKMINIRRSQVSATPIAFGFAIDLDSGFFYTRVNGLWQSFPGSVGGAVVKLNHDYHVNIQGSSEVKELVWRGLVKVNLGLKPFEYGLPDGYRPFKEQ
jgi:uncharacterized protein YecT (DUF1311 family)